MNKTGLGIFCTDYLSLIDFSLCLVLVELVHLLCMIVNKFFSFFVIEVDSETIVV